MKRKRLTTLLMAGVMAISLTACGNNNSAAPSGSGSTAEGNNEESYKIDVILKTTSTEYWQYVVAGAESYSKDHPNVTVDVKGPPSETSFDEQLNMIQTDLAIDYDAYCISPLQSDMVSNLISGTTKPIIALDTKVEADEVISFVGTGTQVAAKGGGEAAVEEAKARGWKDIKCINIAAVQGDETNTARCAGFKEGIESAGGDYLDNEVQYADADPNKAVTAMEGIMAKYPEGVAIIACNNDDMAVAAAQAAANNANYKNTVFLGFDGIQAGCDAILEGSLTLSVAQNGFNMGYTAVDTAIKTIKGETVDEFIDSGSFVVNTENAQEHKDLLQGYIDSIK